MVKTRRTWVKRKLDRKIPMFTWVSAEWKLPVCSTFKCGQSGLNSAANLLLLPWHSSHIVHHVLSQCTVDCHFPLSQNKEQMSSTLFREWNYFITRNKNYNFVHSFGWLFILNSLHVYENFGVEAMMDEVITTDLNTYFIPLSAVSQVNSNLHIHITFTVLSIDFNRPCTLLLSPVRQKRKRLVHGFPVAHHHYWSMVLKALVTNFLPPKEKPIAQCV